MKVASGILILSMAVTFVLLAMQAEIVTAVLGYTFGVLLALAYVLSLVKKD